MTMINKMPTVYDELLPWLGSRTIGLDPFLKKLFDDYSKFSYAGEGKNRYPPYNITKKSNDLYELEIALAGYDSKDLSVYVDEHQLVVESTKETFPSVDVDSAKNSQYIHRGISQRSFKRVFDLSERATVTDAEFINGMLTVRISIAKPEDTRQLIEIKTSSQPAIEYQKQNAEMNP